MKYLGFLCALALVAGSVGCSNSDNNKNDNQTLRDVTDTSSCIGAAQAGATVYQTWTSNYASQNFNVRFQMTFSADNTVTMVAFCGEQYSATVHSRVTITPNTISFLDTDKNGDNNCSASISQSTVSYSLVGNCLGMSNNGQTQYMVAE